MNDEILRRLDRENLSIAPMKKRIMAYFIDEILLSMLFMAVYWNDIANVKNYEQMLALISSLAVELMFLKLIYQTFFIWYYGASIGKIASKIICIDVIMFSKPSFKTSLLRAIVRIFSESLFYLGFIWAFGNVLKQTWHDKLAKTVVIDVY